MKLSKIAWLFGCVLLVASALTADDAKGGLRYSITVTKFENKSGYSRIDIGDAWGAVMTDLLNQTGKFIVLGEKDMRKEALGEQDLGASGRTAAGGKTPVTGQLTPAQLLVKGVITHVQDDTSGGGGGLSYGGIRLGGKGGKGEVSATMYIVDSTTGQVLASKSVTGVASKKGLSVGISRGGGSGDVGGFKDENVGKAVTAAVNEGVQFLISKLSSIPWTGTVVQSANGKVYINRGSREGVATGQSFVVGDAEVVRDPDTGEVLDTSLKEIARIKVDTVKEKLSICSVESGKATAIRKGMAVHTP